MKIPSPSSPPTMLKPSPVEPRWMTIRRGSLHRKEGRALLYLALAIQNWEGREADFLVRTRRWNQGNLEAGPMGMQAAPWRASTTYGRGWGKNCHTYREKPARHLLGKELTWVCPPHPSAPSG